MPPTKKQPKKAERVPAEALDAARRADDPMRAAASPVAKAMSAAISALGSMRDAAGALLDPVKRVCYPPLKVAGQKAMLLKDPLHRICYQPFKVHFEHKYQKRYPKHAGKLFIVDIALLAIIAALITGGLFSYYLLPALPEPKVMDVAIETPAGAAGGSTVTSEIRFMNITPSFVRCPIAELRIPNDFLFERVETAAAEADPACAAQYPAASVAAEGEQIVLVPLPTFAAGDRKTVTVRGIPLAPAGAHVEIPGQFSYWQEGKTQPTTLPFHVRYALTGGSRFSTSVDVPPTILRGYSTAITLSYANEGGASYDGATLRLEAPADFVLTGSIPRSGAGGVWELGALSAGATGSVTAYGYLRATGDRSTAASFGARLFVENQGVATEVASTRTNANADSAGLSLRQELLPADARFLRAGDALTVRVTVTNDSSRTFTAGALRVDVPRELLRLVETDVFAWDGTTLPLLDALEPGASAHVDVPLLLQDRMTPELFAGLDSPVVRIASTLEATPVDAPAERVIIDTAPRDIPLVTDLSLQAAAIYFTREGDQLGRGPVPPVANVETRYRVFVQIDNGVNEAKDVEFTARLADGVAWTGRYSVTEGEAIDYLATSRTVRWRIPRVAAFTAVSGTGAVGASFEVGLTPTEEQRGTIPMLLTDIRVEGRDALHDLRVSAAAQDVSARLPFDYGDERSVVK